MSNANKPAKVLRVALRRLEKGWLRLRWTNRNKQTGVTEVCLEAAIFGYKDDTKNPACIMAQDLTLQVIQEKYKGGFHGMNFPNIPSFNDYPGRTKEEILEVAKLALIRAETGGLLRETEEECYEPLVKAKQAAQAGKFL